MLSAYVDRGNAAEGEHANPTLKLQAACGWSKTNEMASQQYEKLLNSFCCHISSKAVRMVKSDLWSVLYFSSEISVMDFHETSDSWM